MPSLLTFVAAALLAAPAKAPLGDADLAAALKAHVGALAQTGDFSGAVLLAKGDTVLLREAVGLASREARTPNTPETRFNLGSINKAFSRLAIEQLAAQGKLRLGDTLDRYVPEYPVEKGRRITIGQLLEHRAGTGDFFGPKYQQFDKSRLRSLRDWLPLIVERPLDFEPGSEQRYSNAGYLLLGLVVEKVSGQSYYDYVREHVFAPAGMKDTDSYAIGEGVEGLATGYTRRDGPPGDNRRTLPWRGSSAGGGYSTVDDLLRFASAMRSGRLGPRADGMGVAGGAPGINAALEMLGDYTLVVLTNLDPPAAESVAAKVREWRGMTDGPEGGRRVIRRMGADGTPEKPSRTTLPAETVEVPMLHSGHLPAVKVMLNGQGPFLFAIDTGAAGSLRVDQALAERLHLPEVGQARSGDPSGRNARTVPLVAVDSVEIGASRFDGLRGAVRELAEVPRAEKVDGILGFGLFADCLLTLDYPAEKVRLGRGDLPVEDGRDVLAFRSEHGIPSVTMRVAGREMEADVDAGAMGGIILPESEAARLPLLSAPAVVGRARTASNTFEIKAAPLDGDVAIGSVTLTRPTVEFQPLFPMANIGARVLRDLIVTFDQKNHRLRLTKPAGHSAP